MRVGDGVGVGEQLERVHPHVVPAEPAQDLGPQPQRLAEARRDQGRVGLDRHADAVVGADQAELAAVSEGDGDALGLESAGQVDEHRVAVVGHVLGGGPDLDLAQDLGQRDGAVAHAVGVDVARLEAGDDHHRAAGPGHRDGEQPLAAGLAERAEVAQHAAVRGAAVADREDHVVAALGDALLEGRDHERLARGRRRRTRSGLCGRETAVSTACCTRMACFALAVMTISDSVRARAGVIEHERDDPVDLGVDALDGAGLGVGQAVPPET